MNRRSFLKSALLTAASLSCGASLLRDSLTAAVPTISEAAFNPLAYMGEFVWTRVATRQNFLRAGCLVNAIRYELRPSTCSDLMASHLS